MKYDKQSIHFQVDYNKTSIVMSFHSVMIAYGRRIVFALKHNL